MLYIIIFFLVHWYLSAFTQSFFQHRYAAHQMFTMNRFWQKFFHWFTLLAQGPSYLSPRAYARLHRAHHAYSDTEKDPHSPIQEKNFFKMMWKTKERYEDLKAPDAPVEKRFNGGYPENELIDRISESWFYRIGLGALYTFFYMAFVPAGHWYLYLLLPVHWLMGPIHGAIVNWGGHKYGYVNHAKTNDNSKNTLPVEFLVGGELFQNNHHAHPTSPNFAYKWFEFDPTYAVMRVMHALRIIKIQRDVYTHKGKRRFAGALQNASLFDAIEKRSHAIKPLPQTLENNEILR